MPISYTFSNPNDQGATTSPTPAQPLPNYTFQPGTVPPLVNQPAPVGSGVVPNIGAGLLEGEAGIINTIADPVQSMLLSPLSIPVSYAAQGVARLFGMDPDRAQELAREIRGEGAAEKALPPGLGTKLVHGIGNIVGVQPEDITAETPGQKTARVLAAGAASAPLQPGGPVRSVLTGMGSAGGGTLAESMAPDWLKPGAQLMGSVLGGYTPNLPSILERPRPTISGSAVPDPADVRAVSNAYYARIARSSGMLSPQFTNDFIDSIQAGLPQTPGGQAVRGTADPVSDLRTRLETLRDRPMSLQEVQEMDQQLGRAINGQWQQGRLTPDGLGLLDVQQNLRNRIDNITQADMTGGNPAAFADLSNSRQAWTQFRKMDDLQKMWERAQDTDTPSTSMRTQIRALVNNPKRIRGYTDDEINALRDVGDRGIIGGALNIMSSRLLPLLGIATHGPLGAGAAMAAREAAQWGSDTLKGQRVNQAMRTFAAGSPQPITPGATPLPRITGAPMSRAEMMGHLLLTSPLAATYGQ